MKRKVAIVVVACIVMVGLFLLLRPQPAAKNDPKYAARQSFEITLVDGKLAEGADIIRVRQGTEVTIAVKADKADELHIHGYDKALDLVPGKRSQLVFTADQPGQFEAELHGSGTKVFVVEVSSE